MEFEWDLAKAAANHTKHGVTFEEAQSVFDDPFYIDFYDPDHSDDGNRYLVVGRSVASRLLVISYTERNGKTRLISARPTTRQEQRDYEEGQNKMEDNLRPEYELRRLRIRKTGPARTHFAGLLVALEPDVASAFPNADAVNKALRSLLSKTIQEAETSLP